MAFPVTTGTVVKSKTREESPNPGDLYTMEVPILLDGVQEGTLKAEFFVRDAGGVRQRVLDFVRGGGGPRVRWDL